MKIVENLLKVKSIVSLALTALFCYLAATKSVPQDVLTVYLVVIGFYFGTQSEKKVTTNDSK